MQSRACRLAQQNATLLPQHVRSASNDFRFSVFRSEINTLHEGSSTESERRPRRWPSLFSSPTTGLIGDERRFAVQIHDARKAATA